MQKSSKELSVVSDGQVPLAIPPSLSYANRYDHYRNLMAKDEFKNLGFGEAKPPGSTKTDGAEEGKKGELRW